MQKKGQFALLAALAAISMLLSPAASGETLVEEFDDDPFIDHGDGSPVFVRGGPETAFEYDPTSPSAFVGDPVGSLLARYDTVEPTARAFTLLPRPLTAAEPFEINATFTIRSENFFADPSGFAQIAFGFMNSQTTGDDRTGDLEDFAADTFDTLEFDYFPNVSPFFGGPFTGGSVFGGAAGGDAFLNFTFASVPLDLLLDQPVEARLSHFPKEGRIDISISRILPDGSHQALLASPVVLDTSALSPAFLFDAAGIFAYHDGFNIFSESGRSLRADVDFHRLEVQFPSPISVHARLVPNPLFVSTRSRFARAHLTAVDAADTRRLAELAGEAPPIELWSGSTRLAAALSATFEESSEELRAVFDARQVLEALDNVRGDVEILVRGEVEGSDRVFILGIASGSGDNPGRRRRMR